MTCVVADSIMSFAVDAAAELGVPCPLFWTASACGYMGYYNFRFLMEKGLTPLKGTNILLENICGCISYLSRFYMEMCNK